jgi:hypothetical protein
MRVNLGSLARPRSRESKETLLLLFIICGIGIVVGFITASKSICTLFTGFSIVLLSNLTERSKSFRIANYLAFGVLAPVMAYFFIQRSVTYPHPYAALGHFLEVVDFGVFCLLARNVYRRRKAYFALVDEHQRVMEQLRNASLN